MTEVITIANRSGGVGKTTTAHTLGAGLTQRGYKVLLIDLDSQCNLTFFTRANINALNSWDVLTGSATAPEAIQHTASGDVIPASPDLDRANGEINGRGMEYRLKDAIEPVRANYDFIVIDTPPALGVLLINALTACNSCVITANAESKNLQGFRLIADAIETTRNYTNPALRVRGILLTAFEPRTILARDARADFENIAGQLSTKVYSTPIRRCNAVKEAQAMQTDIFNYAPHSTTAEDYRAFIDAVEQGE